MSLFFSQVIQKKIIHQRTAKCLIDIREEVLSYVSTAEPSVESYSNELDYQHAVFLQKIIKGRAIQSILHDGKDSNQELIDQLKETFKLQSVWRAECFDDWNEESLMDFLGQYIDQEYGRYAEQKEICDRRMLVAKERIREENEIQEEQQEVAADCWESVLNDFYDVQSDTNNPMLLPKDETSDLIPDNLLNDESSEIIVDDLISNLVLPEIYKTFSSDEQLEKTHSDRQSSDQQNLMTCDSVEASITEEIVADAIEHILQKVIPHPAADVTNDIIHGIVKKTVELTSSLTELSADNLDKEIGGMLDDLCDQLLNNLDLNDDTDGSGSGSDSP